METSPDTCRGCTNVWTPLSKQFTALNVPPGVSSVTYLCLIGCDAFQLSRNSRISILYGQCCIWAQRRVSRHTLAPQFVIPTDISKKNHWIKYFEDFMAWNFIMSTLLLVRLKTGNSCSCNFEIDGGRLKETASETGTHFLTHFAFLSKDKRHNTAYSILF